METNQKLTDTMNPDKSFESLCLKSSHESATFKSEASPTYNDSIAHLCIIR